nr:hypothetical protein [Tanacetum cinerariifolium]
MCITKEQQQALDDALVPREQRLRIRNCNYKLSTTFKPKEPTFQVALDVLSLTPFYQAFLISGSVLTIYMYEFWVTVSFHKYCIKFNMNKNNYSFDLETFRDMLQICPNLPSQKFVDPPFEEKIIAFIRKLSYFGNIKSLSDVKVEILPQPWRTFGTRDEHGFETSRTGTDGSENRILRKNQSIPRRNKVDWHMAKDDPTLTTMRFIPKHEAVQKYGDILLNALTNQGMKESDAYKTYYDFATGNVISKPKYVRRSTREKTDQAPKDSPGKRLKAIAKLAKSGKKKLHAQGLETLSEIAMSEADQMKLITKRSKIQFHSSQASGSGANEGTGVSPKDDDDDQDDDNAHDEDDDDIEQTESDNDDDDFVHPKLSTFNEEERHAKKLDEEEEGSNQRTHTPSHFKSTNDEVSQGDNVEEEKLDEEKTYEEEKVNEKYNDVNINLEGRDTEMIDALLANSFSVSSGFISKMLNPNPDIGIDSILNLNIESTSLLDVLVTTNDEIPPSSVTTLPPPPIPLIQTVQQTSITTPTIALSTSLQNLPTFGSLFKFEDRVKSLEDDFSKFKQTNLFTEAVSSIPGIVDKYLANQMNEAIKAVVQLQSDRLREVAHAENEDFINKINENIKKSSRSKSKYKLKSKSPRFCRELRTNLSKLELNKILIDTIENNKSIDISVQQKTLYKALVDAYESDKDILTTYGDTVTLKRRRDDKDDDKEPSAGSNRGSKRRRAEKEPESFTKEPIPNVEDLEEPAHQEFETGFTEDHPIDETTMLPDWFQKPSKPPTPDRNWNKTLPDVHEAIQPWISTLARNQDPPSPTFELMKGSCKSLPLPLIPNSRGRRVIPFDHFINNDFVYLSGGVSSRTYATSMTKTKDTDYKHIKWIEDLVPNTMWSQVPIVYDKDALWGISQWGRKRQQLYGYAVNMESARDYNRLCLQDIKDMLLLLVQGKLTNLNIKERLALGVSLRMFTRRIVIQRRVEYLQLGIESYQKKLNLTKPNTYRSNVKRKTPYIAYSNPRENPDEVSAIDNLKREHQSDTQVITMKMEIPLEPTSNKFMVERLYTSAGNHVKEILLKLNLPDHRSILTDSKVTPTKHGRMTKPYSYPCFIANCLNAGYLNMEVKRSQKDKDKDEDPSAGSDRWLKQRKTGKDAEPTQEEPEFEVANSDMPQDQEKNPSNNDEEPKERSHLYVIGLPNPNDLKNPLILIRMTERLHNKDLLKADFSAYIMNGMKISNLTQETLLGPAFKLLKGTRFNYAKLEYDFEECYKALSKKLNWDNPKGDKGCTIDLPGIKDMVSNIWSPVKFAYDKHALWGISHWIDQRKSFYGYARVLESTHDVYSTKCILALTRVKLKEKRMMKSLEKFVGGRHDGTDLRLLQRTI